MEPEFSITLNNSELWNTEGINLTNISSMFVPMIKTKNRTTSNSIISMIYPVIVTEMVLSILCLVLSIIVYSLLPEFKNVHGKNLMSLSSCLLTTYIFLCLDLALRLHISYAFCFTIALVIHISFLATFFWTNVMAFDIWRNMTSMKRKNFERKRETNKYTKYSIYAWTTTVLTALPAVILESTDLVSVQYRPQFGVKRCWLSGAKAFTYYFHIPVGVILLGNLIMFSSTIRQLWLIKKMTAILQVKQQQKKLNLYLKLFIVMGITWFMEFLPLVIKSHKHRYRLYAAAGMLTALHGVLMFAIFVVKRRVIRQIQEKMSGAVSSQKLSISQLTSSTSGQQPTFQTYVNSETFEETEVYIFKKISGQN